MNNDVSSPTDATVAVGLTATAVAAARLPPNTQIGPYRILSLLGEGGMGSVYLAEQQSPVFRQVALKLMREQLSSPLARVWFEVERQALAQMQHPAIAQVYDAGSSEDGTLFLAMELVEGVPITRYCQAHALDRGARLA
ncbi:MAG TPA: protein kinase, partial [Rhodanobacteraceae bacterium]|nr:protein kinase [Rhodanobacteraceae bacterium]